MKNTAKRAFTCKNRCRYSRKRAKIRRNLPKICNYPTGPLPAPPTAHGDVAARRRGPGGWLGLAKLANNFANFAKSWQARSWLYQNEILHQNNIIENMRLTAFFKLYTICILLHRCYLKILAKNWFEKSVNFEKVQQHFCKCCKICKFLPIFKNFS